MPSYNTGNNAAELRLIQIFRANDIIGLRQAYSATSGLEKGMLAAHRLWDPWGLASGVRTPKPKTRDPKPKTRRRRHVSPVPNLALAPRGRLT